MLTENALGFKKNVNRATTQVMMKTGTDLCCVYNPGLQKASSSLNVQGTLRKPTIETMRLKRGTAVLLGEAGEVRRKLIDHRRYRTMESAANRLQKEAKGYLDSLRGSPCFADDELVHEY